MISWIRNRLNQSHHDASTQLYPSALLTVLGLSLLFSSSALKASPTRLGTSITQEEQAEVADPPVDDTAPVVAEQQDPAPESLTADATPLTPLGKNDVPWLEDFRWRAIGPTATGGRVVDIAVDPTNEHHILVASAAGGLWETQNNGTTWNCIFENEGSISLGDIAFDPANPETIWVGTGEANNQRSSLAGDGIYKSTDGGKSWKHMGLRKSQHIGRIVVDPQNSNIVYVAVAGSLYSENEERGLFKTTDGGETWVNVLNAGSRVGVIDVIVHPTDSQIVLAATYERLRRAWNLDEAGPGSAIHRSADGGQTWTRLSGNLPEGLIGRIGLAFCLNEPDTMYATVSNLNPRVVVARAERPRGEPTNDDDNAAPRERRRGGTERRERDQNDDAEDANNTDSDNNDAEAAAAADPQGDATAEAAVAGTDQVETIDSRFGFVLKLQENRWIVSGVTNNSAAGRAGIRNNDQLVSVGGISDWEPAALQTFLQNVLPGDQIQWVMLRGTEERVSNLTLPRSAGPQVVGGEIYRSDDAGLTWKKTNRQPVGGAPPYYYGQIAVDPNDADRLYVLSVPVNVSSDGGKTFNANGARSVHVDHHAIWINPKNSNHVMLGNDGGFHISYDRCETWDYVFNIPMAQFYAITADQQYPYHIYGGLQDNGSWGGPSEGAGGVSADQWYRVGGGDGFYVQVDPSDHNIIYGESQFGAIFRWNRATDQRKSIRPPQSEANSTDGARDRYNWNSPILISQHNPHTIYFGGNKLFMSYNQGDEWLTISPDLTTADPSKLVGNVPHCTITTIAESPLDPNWLMVGTDDGKVHITTDRGQNWNDVSSGFPMKPSSWWCSRVALSHADRATAYVSFTGYREDDFRAFVFKTTDAGKSWISISSNLPAESVNVIKQDPRHPQTLYVGTDLGCYVSINEGQSWRAIEGLPKQSVQDLLVHPRERDLIIGTHGRGIFILDDITPLQETSSKIDNQPAHLFSIRDWVLAPLPGGSSFAGDRKVTAPNSDTGAVIWYQINPAAKGLPVTLVIQDMEGKEVAKLNSPDDIGWHRVLFPASDRGAGPFGGGRRRGGGTAATPPGFYRAVLTVGDETYQQPFQIRRLNQ
jgi:photosystem II stability/assembly factor-like uncharacterized protein